MGKYLLLFSGLNSNSDCEVITFPTNQKRSEYIADKVIWQGGNYRKRVFTLIIHYEDSDINKDIYIFENWSCIKDVVNRKWIKFTLFEWNSYSEAYKNAIDLRESNPLCFV